MATGSIRGQIWLDRNANGLREPGEGDWNYRFDVSLERLDPLTGGWTPVGSQFSLPDGRYSFDGLEAGRYRVHVNQADYRASPIQPGSNLFGPGELTGDIVTGPLLLADGQVLQGVDAGLYLPPIVSGQLWVDANADGQRQPTEAPLAGATVNLLDAAGRLVYGTLSDAEGAYALLTPAPGRYQVEFVAPPGTRFTAADQGADASDSDADPLTGRSAPLELLPNEQRAQVDAGLLGARTDLATFRPRFWNDANGNGVQEASEPGLAGVQVALLDAGGLVIGRATTDARGELSLQLPAGTYGSALVFPAGGWQAAAPRQGSDRSRDSDLDADGLWPPIRLSAGQVLDDLDAGLVRPIRLGDRVWNDLDRDGLQDAGEPGVPGVEVRLLGDAGQTLGQAVTDADGRYAFEGLAPGRYELAFLRPADMAWTVRGSSVVDPATGRTGVHELLSGRDVLAADAGLVALSAAERARIGDRVFEDLNGNGLQDAGEPGLAGVTIRLLDLRGEALAQTVTDAQGLWRLSVAPGSYRIQAGGSSLDLAASPAFRGADPERDSNADARGLSAPFTVLAGQTDLSLDVGAYRPARIQGSVWDDRNGNGLREADETGGAIAGIRVSLIDGLGQVQARTLTDALGLYRFDRLASGSVAVRFEPPAGRGFTAADAGDEARDSDVQRNSGRSADLLLRSGDRVSQLDAGLAPGNRPAAVITGQAFHDRNGNGLQEAGEPGLPGVLMRLQDALGRTVDLVRTDADGRYRFVTGADGYRVQASGSAGWAASPMNQGSDDTRDSDFDAAGLTALLAVSAGQVLTDLDIGAWRPAAGTPATVPAGSGGVADGAVLPLGLVLDAGELQALLPESPQPVLPQALPPAAPGAAPAGLPLAGWADAPDLQALLTGGISA